MKKIIKIVILIILTFIILKIEMELKEDSFFSIKDIYINETSSNLKENLEILRKNMLEKNINEIDLKHIERKIKEDIRVENVVVTSDNINKILITVTERKNMFYGQYKNNIYLIDQNGVIFGRINEYKKGNYPIIILGKEKSLEVNIKILTKLRDLDFLNQVSQIKEIDETLIEIVLIGGSKIKTNTEITKDRYKLLIEFYRSLDTEVEYIDIRYKDIILKEKG